MNQLEQLAKNLVTYSIALKKGERVYLEATGFETHPLVRALIDEIYQNGGEVYLDIKDSRLQRRLIQNGTEAQFQHDAKLALEKMKTMDAYIGIRGGDNISALSDVPKEKISSYQKAFHEVLRERVDNTKWVVLRYPNASMAQLAEMSLEGFEDFYFKVCNFDYAKMDEMMNPLKALMEKTDKVRIVAPNTDLTFSIKGISAVKCSGKANIPDGEVYTAPVRNSVNGTISYNTPSLYQGFVYDNVKLTFKDGKIIEALANDTEKINHVFDTDEGARFVGGFAIGVNPHITKPMKDILFDEKISGSIHFTPGACYEDAYNGNQSAIHWDLVLIQTPEYGGGEIYFDDVLIRKDGLFVHEDLLGLNPENLQ